jgi:hypothetical protein
LRESALRLSGAKNADDTDDSPALRLLADIRRLWPTDAANMMTASMLEGLRGLEESPWADYQISARKLAKWLRPFGVTSLSVRDSSVTAKGYRRADFEGPWNRYLPIGDVPAGTTSRPA